MAFRNGSEAPWYVEYFGPGYLEECGNALTQERTLAETDFILRALSLPQNARILDCPCGQGRHTAELVRRGYHVVGFDLSMPLLLEAARSADPSPRLVRGDMRALPFREAFDAAVNIFSSFGYLENDAEDLRALREIAGALRPGGRFLLDTINKDHLLRTYRARDWHELPDGGVVCSEKTFDVTTGRNIDRRIRISADGRREAFTMALRIYSLPELEGMLRESGLRPIASYGDFDGRPVSLDSRRYILCAEKAEL
jgi:SAM-dependent methyltransferase